MDTISHDQVLTSQRALNAKRVEVRQVQDAIEKQSMLVQNGVADQGIQQLEVKRDDLAAALALGQGDAAALAEIEAQISQLRLDLEAAAVGVNIARSAIAGLTRKLSDLHSQLTYLEGQHGRLLLLYLKSEANKEQQAYIEKAYQLKVQYMRIAAYSQLASRIDRMAGDFAITQALSLPVSAKLDSGKGIRHVNDEILFSSNFMHFSKDLPIAVSELSDQLREAGLALP